MDEDSTYWQNQAKRLEGQVKVLDAQTDVLERRIEELVAENANLKSHVNYFETRERDATAMVLVLEQQLDSLQDQLRKELD